MNDAAGSLRWGMDSPLEVTAALLLAAVFVGSVLAARRRLGSYARLRWFGVVVLNATASLAIYALLVPPVLERPAADTITLLTEGASTAPAAITDAYVSPGAGDYGRGPGYLLDIAQLTLKEPALGTLTVTGHGLDASEWQRLPDDLAIRYDPPPLSGLVEIEWRQSLAEGDLLVVEGHGNKNEIGRVGVWDGSIGECVHQNHLIRVRCDRSRLHPRYAEAFMNSQIGRRSLLRASNTTSGLNTISTGDVRSVELPLPGLAEQEIFVRRAESIDSHRDRLLTSESCKDVLFGSLQQRAFRGEL